MIEDGKLLAGRYRLIEQIDSGGTAFIYRATDEMTEQVVAVKILRPELTENEEFVQRFKKEVHASLKLRHANIIRGYDAGLDDGMYYIVMELIEGKTLKQLINEGGPLPLGYVVAVAKKLCLALEYAHVKGFIHRDIKPHNVMVDKTGEPFIADFGIAKNLETNTITMEDNSVMGSVHYFSPEQARGERADKRSDLYSLGILMYEMLAGEVPFDGDTSVAIALKHINEPMPNVRDEEPDVPESISKIILKASQKDKHFRYKSAFAMYEDLQRCMTEPDGEYIKYTESKRAQQYVDEAHMRRTRRGVNKVLLSLGVGVAAVAVIIVLFSVFIDRSAVQAIEVVDVIGQNDKKASEMLSNSGLQPKTVTQSSGEATGTVLSQEPLGGETVEPGSVVTIYVSGGLGTGIMPYVVDIPLEQAEEELRLAGIEVTEVERSTEGEYAIGFVMEQTPDAGTAVEEGGRVTLKVKISPEELKAPMPGVEHTQVGQAIAALNESGFGVYYIYEEESEEAEGNVVLQEPAAETGHPVNQPVRLHISRMHANTYVFEGSMEIDVPADKTNVVIAIEDMIDDNVVYYVMHESVDPQGAIEKNIMKELQFDSEQDTVEKKMVIFLNNELYLSRMIQFTREGDTE